jgi:hypothetical protein
MVWLHNKGPESIPSKPKWWGAAFEPSILQNLSRRKGLIA